MEALAAAKRIYLEEAERAEGKRANVLGERLREASERIARMQGDTVEHARILTDVSRHLADANEAIESSVGEVDAQIKALPDGIAGQARLATAGSESFDAEAIMGNKSVIDGEWALGVAKHEQEHTRQQAANAEEVRLENGTAINEHDFLEAAAIAAQEKKAPGSVDGLSDDYLDIRRRIGGILSQDRLIGFARKGDLTGFAEAADERIAA